MSAADVEVVREMLEAFNRRDYEGSVERFNDDVVFEQSPELPDSDTYRGKDEFQKGMALWLSGFERGFQFDFEELVDGGKRVFARVTLRGVGRSSGVELKQRVFHVYEVRDGRIAQLWVMWDEDEARRTAGLEEAEQG